jgi:hypothetical protein
VLDNLKFRFILIPYTEPAESSEWAGTCTPGRRDCHYNSGNVGIGTASPTQKLTVAGNVYLSAGGYYSASGGNSYSYVTDLYGGNTYVDDLMSIGNNWLRTGESTGSVPVAALGTAEILLGAGNVANNGNYGYISFATGGVRGGTPVGRMMIADNGNVGIGTANPTRLLHVAGTIGAEEVIVSSTGADYVFAPKYRLAPLKEIAAYVAENHHLPDIPSEAEVREKGVSLGEMQSKLLAKVEELTLHMIQEHERNDRLERQNHELQERIARLEAQSAR